ncbi:MAG: GNAT family N-acetyltransferase, partial [Terriglobales bacterium]
GYTEISAVCTHPEARGQGLAAALVAELVERIRARGETPYLNVASSNGNAIRVYERLGFAFRRGFHVVVLRSRPPVTAQAG